MNAGSKLRKRLVHGFAFAYACNHLASIRVLCLDSAVASQDENAVSPLGTGEVQLSWRLTAGAGGSRLGLGSGIDP
jgi:hypothetical protein